MLLMPALCGLRLCRDQGGDLREAGGPRTPRGLGPQTILARPVPQQVPRGLDDPRWDFSPKEETDAASSGVPGRRVEADPRPMVGGVGLVLRRDDGVGLGTPDDDSTPDLSRSRRPGRRGVEGRLLGLFAAVYTLALLRHSTSLGYLSWRHVLPLVVASIPWAAGGTFICCRRIAELLRLGPARLGIARLSAMAFALGLSVAVQMNPNHLNHLSRWGHWAAGRWLAAHAAPDEEVLDTRGWARFISGRPGYDYWHVRQALTDSHLSYILVGLDELEAASARAATLRALLAYAGDSTGGVPGLADDPRPAVRIYRFRRPASWEGIAR